MIKIIGTILSLAASAEACLFKSSLVHHSPDAYNPWWSSLDSLSGDMFGATKTAPVIIVTVCAVAAFAGATIYNKYYTSQDNDNQASLMGESNDA